MSRSRVPWGVVALLFVVIPLVEIYFIVRVGQVIGPWWVLLLLVADGILGAALVRREGAKAWAALRTALSSHRMPSGELADGALILIGGTLMLTPGFLTDLVGLFFVFPLTRPVARRLLARVVARRLGEVQVFGTGPVGPARRPSASPQDRVVPGEVVDDGRPDPRP